MRHILLLALLLTAAAAGFGAGPSVEELFTRAKSSSNSVQAWENCGSEALKQGYYITAQSAYENLVRLRPDESYYYHCLASCRIKNGRPDLAYALLTNIIPFFPVNSRLHCDLGLSLYKLGNFTAATSAYEKALSNSRPADRAFILTALGRCYRERKDFTRSREAFRESLRLKEDFWTYYEYGRMLEASGDIAGALWAYRKGRAWCIKGMKTEREIASRRLAGVLYSLGMKARDAGKPAEALRYFTEILNDHDMAVTSWAEKAAFWKKRLGASRIFYQNLVIFPV